MAVAPSGLDAQDDADAAIVEIVEAGAGSLPEIGIVHRLGDVRRVDRKVDIVVEGVADAALGWVIVPMIDRSVRTSRKLALPSQRVAIDRVEAREADSVLDDPADAPLIVDRLQVGRGEGADRLAEEVGPVQDGAPDERLIKSARRSALW
jgi:hypothetical protein